MIGQVIAGDLKITECIAQGGTGSVYKAVEPSAEHRVAVKILTTRTSADDDAYRCFRNEVLSLARITHPHAVRLYDWGRTPQGYWYIVMELLEGRCLDEVLRDGPVPLARSLEILDDVAAVLEEAHDLGIVHRDIKPANIMLQRVSGEDFVRVLDFGIARLVNQPASSDRPSGTPAYMAPEQIQGVEVDGRADIYSLGVVAYECLGGRPPFDEATPITLMAKQVSEVPKPLRLPIPSLDVPPGLVDFVSQLLEKDADRRPSSIREVRARLGEYRRLFSTTSTTSLPGIVTAEELGLIGRPWFQRPADNPPDNEHSGAWSPDDDGEPDQPVLDDARLILFGLLAVLLAVGLVVLGFARSSGDDRDGEDDAPGTALSAPLPLPASPAPAPAAQDAGFAKDAGTRIVRTGARRRRHALRVCYELFGAASITAPQLFVDGRLEAREADQRCFAIDVTEGRHTFTVVGQQGRRASVRRGVGAGTDGVFLLIE